MFWFWFWFFTGMVLDYMVLWRIEGMSEAKLEGKWILYIEKKQTSRFTQLGISSFNPRSLLERIRQRKHFHFRM